MKIIIFLGILFAFSTGWSAPHGIQKSRIQKSKSFYSDGLQLRTENRVGIGFNVSGVSGVAGLQMELNFNRDTGLLAGFGFGGGYQSFHLAYKRVIGGKNFLPYIVAGYTRWYTTTDQRRDFSTTRPAVLGEKFLSGEEKNGKFDEHFIFPGIGVQYLQLKGDYVGSSIFMDLVLMLDIDDFVIAPLGSFGMIYYF